MAGFLQSIYQQAFGIAMGIAERNLVPDFVIRRAIRQLLAQRIADGYSGGEEAIEARLQAFVEDLKQQPIAVQTKAANEQHYEVPTEYFLLVLGKNLKYSSCLFADRSTTLDEAEITMLGGAARLAMVQGMQCPPADVQNLSKLCCQRAELQDGQSVLELGCGWGSMCLYVAAKYPGSQVTAVSNSKTQKQHIDEQCRLRGIKNLQVITADVVNFQPEGQFDRAVSIEMFEHMKNYQELMRRVDTWLRPGGKLFVHIFCHRRIAYHFEALNEDDWMARHFFSGGTMPSRDLLGRFQSDLVLQQQWFINGVNYSRTLEAWLQRHDRHRKQIMLCMKATYGEADSVKWFVRWRFFYMACSELFSFGGGNEWGVGHYLFSTRDHDTAC